MDILALAKAFILTLGLAFVAVLFLGMAEDIFRAFSDEDEE